MNTSGWELGPTWPPWTSTKPNSSVAAKPKPESPPLIAWSIKSCNSIPIAGREGFSGSSTTVLRIEVPGQSKGSRASIPTWCSFTGPSMPVGSIKSKSISRSSNERSCRPTIFLLGRSWQTVYWLLSGIMKPSPGLSSGVSRDTISLDCCGDWATPRSRQPRKYVTEHMKRPTKYSSREVRRRVRHERRRVALAYLAVLRGGFQSLLRMANVIAALSPEVAAVHEFERLRLTAKFAWQYEMIRWKLLAGFATVPQLDGLSDLVSGLSVRMEAAMKELGERAAAAAELASSINRRGLDVT